MQPNLRWLMGAGLLVILPIAGACGTTAPQVGSSPRAAWTVLDDGWTRLPDPPEMRAGAAYVWAGSDLVAWGGCAPEIDNDCVRTGDGFAFDPVKEVWTRLAEAPATGAWADAVWTGSEALFVNLNDEGMLEGVAYDPISDAWRAIAPGPVSSRAGGVEVWTGTELIVWGGGRPGDPSAANGAAYDPEADTWRRIAEAPRGLNAASGMWTGTEVLVFGSLLDGRNWADTQTSVGLSYDPAEDMWSEIPPSRLSPQATSANWIADRMVAWDYEVRWQEFEPTSGEWTSPQVMPFEFNECYPDSVVAADLVFAFFCGRAAVYDPALGMWGSLGGGPLDDEMQVHGNSYKVWRFASLVPAGDVVFMPMQGMTVTDDGTPCYGCEGTPVSMWAYRFPGRAGSDAR